MPFFKNNFFHAMAVLSYLTKLKRDLGLAFVACFLHDFSINIFLNQLTKFQCHTFISSEDINQNIS